MRASKRDSFTYRDSIKHFIIGKFAPLKMGFPPNDSGLNMTALITRCFTNRTNNTKSGITLGRMRLSFSNPTRDHLHNRTSYLRMNISLGKDSIIGCDAFIDSTKHISIEGMSGMGNSTLLVNLLIAHIREGSGGLFIDPHADTADQIAKLIPKSRMRIFIWIDPDASLVPPFNPLHFNSPEELELGKDSLFTTFKSLARSAWRDESARVIINAIEVRNTTGRVPKIRDHPSLGQPGNVPTPFCQRCVFQLPDPDHIQCVRRRRQGD